MLFPLFALANAHMHIYQPRPRFTNGPGNENAPIVADCTLVRYTPDAQHVVLQQYKSNMAGRTVREIADQCGKKCGHTIPSHIVPIPTENKVKINVGARHVGVLEIWIDDTRVVQSDRLMDEYNVDFSICQGTCLVRFVMAALHRYPAEIFDNCVMISGGGTRPKGLVQGPAVPVVNVPKSAPVANAPKTTPVVPVSVPKTAPKGTDAKEPAAKAPKVIPSPTPKAPAKAPTPKAPKVTEAVPKPVAPTKNEPDVPKPSPKEALAPTLNKQDIPDTPKKCKTQQEWSCKDNHLHYRNSSIMIPCHGVCKKMIDMPVPACFSE